MRQPSLKELARQVVDRHDVQPDGLASLPPKQASARREALTRLAANPTVKRAFVTRWEDDVLIVTLAVRGVGTCELQIASDRFDRTNPADPVALIACLMNPEGSA